MNSPLQMCAKCFNFMKTKRFSTCSFNFKASCSWVCTPVGQSQDSRSSNSNGILLRRPCNNGASASARSMFRSTSLITRSMVTYRPKKSWPNQPNAFPWAWTTHLLSPLNDRKSSWSRQLVRGFAETQSDSPNPLPPRKKSKDNSQKSPISWRNLFIVAGVGGGLLLGMRYVKNEKEIERQKARNLRMGKAKLGGDWTLVDHHGKLRSSTDFRGQWLLIYFGFTNCPDICPEEIEKIVSVINKTDADRFLPKIQPVIITVDPDRDTPESMKEYCAEFSPRLLGFSGSTEQIQSATRAYRVYFSQGPKDEDNDYIVDHSIISYLVNPKGEFVDFYGQNKKEDEIYRSIKLQILAYDKQDK